MINDGSTVKNDFNMTVRLSELLWKSYRINNTVDTEQFGDILTEDKILAKLGCGEVGLITLGEYAYNKSPLEYAVLMRTDRSGFDYIGRFEEIMAQYNGKYAVINERGLLSTAFVIFPEKEKDTYRLVLRELAEERMKFSDNTVIFKKDVVALDDIKMFETILRSNNSGTIAYSDNNGSTLYFMPLEQERVFDNCVKEFNAVKNKLNNIEVMAFEVDKNLGKYAVERISAAEAYALRKTLIDKEADGVYLPAVEFYNTDVKGQILIKYAMAISNDIKDESKKYAFRDLIEQTLKETKTNIADSNNWQISVASNEVSLMKSLVIEGQGSDTQYLVKIPRTKGKEGDFQGEGKSKCLLVNKNECREDSNGNLIFSLNFNEIHNIYNETGKQFSDTVNDNVNKMSSDELREKFNKVSKFKDIKPAYSTAINEKEYVELYNKELNVLLQVKLETIDKIKESLKGVKSENKELFQNDKVINNVLKNIFDELNDNQKNVFLSFGACATNKDKDGKITAVDEDGVALTALSEFLNVRDINAKLDDESKTNALSDTTVINKLESQYSVWKLLNDTGGENATNINEVYENLKKAEQYEGKRALIFDKSANCYTVMPKVTQQEMTTIIQESLKCSPLFATLITEKASEKFSDIGFDFFKDTALMSIDNGKYGNGSILSNISFGKNGNETFLIKEDGGKLNTVCFDKNTDRKTIEKRLSKTFGIKEQSDMAVILDRLYNLKAVQSPTEFKTPDNEYTILLTTSDIWTITENNTEKSFLINKDDLNEKTLEDKLGISGEGIASEKVEEILKSIGAYQYSVEKVKETAVKTAKNSRNKDSKERSSKIKTKQHRQTTVQNEKSREVDEAQDKQEALDDLKLAEKNSQRHSSENRE